MQDVPIFARALWVAPIVLGCILLYRVGGQWIEAERSAEWVPVSATIIQVGGQRGLLTSQSWGSYRWRFAGQTYEGSEIDCCQGEWGDWFAVAGKHQKGDTVTAFVDADQPHRAVLMAGDTRNCRLPGVVGVALFAVGLWLRRRIETPPPLRTIRDYHEL